MTTTASGLRYVDAARAQALMAQLAQTPCADATPVAGGFVMLHGGATGKTTLGEMVARLVSAGQIAVASPELVAGDARVTPAIAVTNVHGATAIAAQAAQILAQFPGSAILSSPAADAVGDDPAPPPDPAPPATSSSSSGTGAMVGIILLIGGMALLSGHRREIPRS